jgi:hypothetical protein
MENLTETPQEKFDPVRGYWKTTEDEAMKRASDSAKAMIEQPSHELTVINNEPKRPGTIETVVGKNNSVFTKEEVRELDDFTKTSIAETEKSSDSLIKHIETNKPATYPSAQELKKEREKPLFPNLPFDQDKNS